MNTPKIIVRTILVTAMFFLVCVPTSIFAETHIQKDGLFSMDVPSGWRWDENEKRVELKNPDFSEEIYFGFRKLDGFMLFLSRSVPVIMKIGIKLAGGNVVSEKKVTVDNINGTRIDMIMTTKGRSSPGAMTFFWTKDYLFMIGFESYFEKERLEIEKIIKTFRFENKA